MKSNVFLQKIANSIQFNSILPMNSYNKDAIFKILLLYRLSEKKVSM